MFDLVRFFSVSGLDSVLDVLPTVVITALIYWFSRRKKHKKLLGGDFKEVRKRARLNEMIRLIFVCYITGLVCMTLFPTQFWGSLWGLSFRTVLPSRYLGWRFHYKPILWEILIERFSLRYFLRYLFLGYIENVIFFVPLGFLLPFVWKKATFAKSVLVGFACTVFIELAVQPLINRDGSLDDIICNTLGAVVGYPLYLLMKKLFPKFTEKCKIQAVEKSPPNPQ